MKIKVQTIVVVLGLVTVTFACSLPTGMPTTPTQVDQVGTIVATTMQALTATPSQSVSTPIPNQTGGIPVSYENVSFVIPGGVASGANTEKMVSVDTNSGAPWEIAPTHLRFTLTGYQLQGKFFESQIYVYPADEYAQVNSVASEQIERLKKALSGAPLLKETLPNVPFFNAAHIIAANIKLINFQNGSGVRELTQYDQYPAPINNHELFYHFEGLTSDTKYYIIAVLPITAPILAEDEKPESSLPAGGIPIPTDVGPNDVYYFSVTEKLNSMTPDSFSPSMTLLDALIQSILVKNP
jgi:hypothetical protein